MRPIAERLFGWTPFRAAMRGPDMCIDWCHLGSRRMTEPFFHATIARAMEDPFNLAFQQRTPITALADLPNGLPALGFIFHMSRCGSTLVAQALAALEAAIVVSEAAPLRTVLDALHYGCATPEQAQVWLTGLVNAYAQPRFAYERAFFVKFMAADVLDLPLIRHAFPNVPWLFLYRDPLEILASQKVAGGPDAMPGGILPHRLGLASDEPHTMGLEAYLLTTLTAFARAALAAHAESQDAEGGRGMILDYAALPEALETLIPAHFGFVPDAAARGIIRAAAKRDAKAPDRAFAGDSAAKQAVAAPWADLAQQIAGLTFAALDRANAG